MTYRKYIYSLVCLYLCSTFDEISADEDCDKSKCSGPLAYYESLGCTPIYSTEGDCCAVRYNCDHLRGRSKDKCYYRGGFYEIGEPLKKQDAKPCDIGCFCQRGFDGIASFNCALVNCPTGPPKPGCYRKRSPLQCCPGEEVCPKNASDRARCEVDGKTYLDGEQFEVQSDPKLNCICQPGYEGNNVLPFCANQAGLSFCSPELRHASDIYNNCTPVYYSSQSPATSCSVFSRCQNRNDVVIHADADDSEDTSDSDSDFKCIFGNLTMNVGDELNQGTGYNSVCVKCVCEVPPTPTCQRLPDEECDVTVHANFDGY